MRICLPLYLCRWAWLWQLLLQQPLCISQSSITKTFKTSCYQTHFYFIETINVPRKKMNAEKQNKTSSKFVKHVIYAGLYWGFYAIGYHFCSQIESSGSIIMQESSKFEIIALAIFTYCVTAFEVIEVFPTTLRSKRSSDTQSQNQKWWINASTSFFLISEVALPFFSLFSIASLQKQTSHGLNINHGQKSSII